MSDRIDFSKLKRHAIKSRRSLVKTADFATLPGPGATVEELLKSLPNIQAGRDFRELVAKLRAVIDGGGGIVAAMGAHVIKCGLSPVIIDLMKRGVITAVATNGAGAIHDYEIALCGQTSESVDEELPRGRFGMTKETAQALAKAAKAAHESGTGLGRALGALIIADGLPEKDKSILAAGAALGIPVTVHVAIGADVVHMHPEADGADIGAASMEDFRTVCGVVAGLAGGAWLNIGSAVILPEVFLKAVAVARNLGVDLDSMTTANFDMYDLYRPRTNVVNRPAGKGYQILGRHEIMLPLLRLALISPV